MQQEMQATDMTQLKQFIQVWHVSISHIVCLPLAQSLAPLVALKRSRTPSSRQWRRRVLKELMGQRLQLTNCLIRNKTRQ